MERLLASRAFWWPANLSGVAPLPLSVDLTLSPPTAIICFSSVWKLWIWFLHFLLRACFRYWVCYNWCCLYKCCVTFVVGWVLWVPLQWCLTVYRMVGSTVVLLWVAVAFKTVPTIPLFRLHTCSSNLRFLYCNSVFRCRLLSYLPVLLFYPWSWSIKISVWLPFLLCSTNEKSRARRMCNSYQIVVVLSKSFLCNDLGLKRLCDCVVISTKRSFRRANNPAPRIPDRPNTVSRTWEATKWRLECIFSLTKWRRWRSSPYATVINCTLWTLFRVVTSDLSNHHTCSTCNSWCSTPILNISRPY